MPRRSCRFWWPSRRRGPCKFSPGAIPRCWCGGLGSRMQFGARSPRTCRRTRYKGDLTRLRPAQTAGCRMARNRTQRDCSRKCNPISSRSSAASGRRASACGSFHGSRTAPSVAPNCHARRASRRRRAQGRVRVGRCRAGVSTARGLGHYSRATLFKLLDSKDLVRGAPAGGDYGDQDEILVRLVPAVSEAGFDDERHRQFAMRRTGAFHDHFRDLGGRASFGLGHLEQ